MKWFYSTWLGGKYLELLVWYDLKKNTNDVKKLSPKEMAQVIRESSKIADGTNEVKRKVNSNIVVRNTSNYHNYLTKVKELIPLAERDKDSAEGKMAEAARMLYVRKGDKDVVTATDHAKMIDTRINAMYELHDHIRKREMSRQIRKLQQDGNKEEADKLLEEWKKKYGR